MLELDAYLDRLASADPTPGGGSAAALVGAMAAALLAMVARITLAGAKLAAVHPEAQAIAARADDLRARFVAARPRDEAAYQAVVSAQALPRGNDAEKAERTERLQAALAAAAGVPLEVCGLAAETLALCERTARLRNAHLMSDVECALRFARASLDAGIANVRVNHRFIKDTAVVSAQAQQLAVLVAAARESEAHALPAIAEH